MNISKEMQAKNVQFQNAGDSNNIIQDNLNYENYIQSRQTNNTIRVFYKYVVVRRKGREVMEGARRTN